MTNKSEMLLKIKEPILSQEEIDWIEDSQSEKGEMLLKIKEPILNQEEIDWIEDSQSEKGEMLYCARHRTETIGIEETLAQLKKWMVGVFVHAIRKVPSENDRYEISQWLEKSRDVLGSEKTKLGKMKELYAMTNSKKAVSAVINSVVESVKNYKNSNLPLAVKIAVPATLLAAPFIGGS